MAGFAVPKGEGFREMQYLPDSLGISVDNYIADYRVRKQGNYYYVQCRRFYNDRWVSVLKLKAKGSKQIVDFLRDENKKVSILKTTNEYVDRRYPMIFGEMAFANMVKDRLETFRNINRMIQPVTDKGKK